MRAEVVRDRSLTIPPRPERTFGRAAARARLPRPAVCALRRGLAPRLGGVLGQKAKTAFSPLADLADDLVAVHRPLREQCDDGGTDVAAARLVASAEMAWGEAAPRAEARAAAPVAAAAAHEENLQARVAAGVVDCECGHT